MNVVAERLPDSRVSLDIRTGDEEFAKALDKAYRTVVRQVRLPGFRPGKAPRTIVEKMLGRGIIVEQADKELLDPLYRQALESENLRPVGEPEVEIYQAEPLAFRVTVEVYPSVELGDYQAVRVEPRQIEIGDEQVAAALEHLKRQHSPWQVPADARPAREGDRVTLDIEVTEEGIPYREPLVGGRFVLGEDNLFPALRETILGMSLGEVKETRLSFGADDEQAEADMRGKTLDYRVTLRELEEQQFVDFDDAFAALATSGRTTSIEQLRDDIRRELRRVEREKAQSEVATEVINAMAGTATFDVPRAMIDRQLDTEVEELGEQLKQRNGQTLDAYLRLQNKTLEQLREELRPEASRRLRNSLVMREIATREAVSVSAQDVDAEVDRLVGGAGDAGNMRQIYGSPYVRNILETELFERRLRERMIEIATEGRGAYEPPADPDELAGDDETVEVTPAAVAPSDSAPDDQDVVEAASAAGASPDEGERDGVLPSGHAIPLSTGEAVADTETVVPPAKTADGSETK